MTDDLLERLTNPMVPYDPEVDAQGFWEDLCADAKDRIEALTTQLAEHADVRTQIDHRLEELVGQVDALTAERDEAICGNHRSNEYELTLAELTGVWKARAEGAEAENARLRLLVREADELIGGDLTGLQWKRECREFRVKARAALPGNVTVGGGWVDWGASFLPAAPTGKADT